MNAHQVKVTRSDSAAARYIRVEAAEGTDRVGIKHIAREQLAAAGYSLAGVRLVVIR